LTYGIGSRSGYTRGATRAKMEAEAEARQRKSEEYMETEKILERLSKIADEMQRPRAEEFIYDALRETPRIGDLEFECLYMNFKSTSARSKKSAEYDLVMTNGEFAAIVEIKHKLHRNDVEKVRTVLEPNFRYLLRQLSDKTLVPVVAGMTADPDAIALAHECGYAVLLPDGQKIRADTTHLRYIPQQG